MPALAFRHVSRVFLIMSWAIASFRRIYILQEQWIQVTVLATMPHPERSVMAGIGSWTPDQKADAWSEGRGAGCIRIRGGG